MKWFISVVQYSVKGGFVVQEGYYKGTRKEAIEAAYAELDAAALLKFDTLDGSRKVEFCYKVE